MWEISKNVPHVQFHWISRVSKGGFLPDIVLIIEASGIKSKPLIPTWYRSYSQEVLQKEREKKRNSKKGIQRLLIRKISVWNKSEWGSIQTGKNQDSRKSVHLKKYIVNPRFWSGSNSFKFLYITRHTARSMGRTTCQDNTCFYVYTVLNFHSIFELPFFTQNNLYSLFHTSHISGMISHCVTWPVTKA